MRVLLLNQVFYPDIAATAQHAHDLARDLVAHGHEVQVIASRSIYGERGAPLARREDLGGIEVHRVGRSLFGKASVAARLLDFGLFYVAATVKALTIRRPDVVICFTTPPFIALVGWLLRVLRGARFVYWVMDLYPDVPVGCGVMRQGSLACRFFESLNRFCLARADRVVVLGRCMMERVLSKGIDPGHVRFIGVWCDSEAVQPIPKEENPYRLRWNLQDKFVVMYSGNFGLAHDVATMCEAAAALADDQRIAFLFVGGERRSRSSNGSSLSTGSATAGANRISRENNSTPRSAAPTSIWSACSKAWKAASCPASSLASWPPLGRRSTSAVPRARSPACCSNTTAERSCTRATCRASSKQSAL